jgi:phosphoribosylglycinamide formyltransferase-1
MNVVVFGSGSGTNLEALLKSQFESSDGFQNNPKFRIAALFSDRLCRFQQIGRSHNLPVIYHSFAKFIKDHKYNSPNDREARIQYDQLNLQMLLEISKKNNFTIDLILLAGYMRIVYEPLLSRFKNKIINIHPADLTKVDDQGRRIYVGANAVKDALLAGETKTRSSIIIVDEEIDTGPVLASGSWVPYEEGFPITEEKIQRHQDKQKIHSDWPACITVIELISQGRFALDGLNNVYFDGVLQPKCGLEFMF